MDLDDVITASSRDPFQSELFEAVKKYRSRAGVSDSYDSTRAFDAKLNEKMSKFVAKPLSNQNKEIHAENVSRNDLSRNFIGHNVSTDSLLNGNLYEEQCKKTSNNNNTSRNENYNDINFNSISQKYSSRNKFSDSQGSATLEKDDIIDDIIREKKKQSRHSSTRKTKEDIATEKSSFLDTNKSLENKKSRDIDKSRDLSKTNNMGSSDILDKFNSYLKQYNAEKESAVEQDYRKVSVQGLSPSVGKTSTSFNLKNYESKVQSSDIDDNSISSNSKSIQNKENRGYMIKNFHNKKDVEDSTEKLDSSRTINKTVKFSENLESKDLPFTKSKYRSDDILDDTYKTKKSDFSEDPSSSPRRRHERKDDKVYDQPRPKPVPAPRHPKSEISNMDSEKSKKSIQDLDKVKARTELRDASPFNTKSEARDKSRSNESNTMRRPNKDQEGNKRAAIFQENTRGYRVNENDDVIDSKEQNIPNKQTAEIDDIFSSTLRNKREDFLNKITNKNTEDVENDEHPKDKFIHRPDISKEQSSSTKIEDEINSIFSNHERGNMSTPSRTQQDKKKHVMEDTTNPSLSQPEHKDHVREGLASLSQSQAHRRKYIADRRHDKYDGNDDDPIKMKTGLKRVDTLTKFPQPNDETEQINRNQSQNALENNRREESSERDRKSSFRRSSRVSLHDERFPMHDELKTDGKDISKKDELHQIPKHSKAKTATPSKSQRKEPMKATLPIEKAVKPDVNVKPKTVNKLKSDKLANSKRKSASLTNISNLQSAFQNSNNWESEENLNSMTLRSHIYNEWLAKKNDKLRLEQKNKQKTKLKEEEEKLANANERKNIAKKTYNAWFETKTEKLKSKKSDERKRTLSEKEKQDELEQKKKDAKKFFESWKQNKDEKLKEKHRKEKRETQEKKQKELEEKEERANDAKKTFEIWKSKKDEHLKERMRKEKEKKQEKEYEQTEKHERKQTAQRVFEAWKSGKDSRPSSARSTSPMLTQRAWCPNSRNSNATVIPPSVQPVILRKSPSIRSRTFSANGRLQDSKRLK